MGGGKLAFSGEGFPPLETCLDETLLHADMCMFEKMHAEPGKPKQTTSVLRSRSPKILIIKLM